MTSFNANNGFRPVDLNKFRSVLADKPSTKVSDKYLFIPTTQALTVLADHGWFPVQVKQANTRIEENHGYQKHVIRLANERLSTELMVGDTIPQLMLTNSHSGTSSFELAVALFRKVCANGLCVSDATLEAIKIRHLGYQDNNMSIACMNLAKNIPNVLQEVEDFKKIALTQAESEAFAKAAIEMRFDDGVYSVAPSQLLRRSRYADSANDLWTTYNVVQENVIRGGVRQRRKDGTSIRSREVKNIDENTRLNRALWTLQKEMAALKQNGGNEINL